MSRRIVDDRTRTVVCAGVRLGPFTRKVARATAVGLVREWAELGMRRKAEIFYCDGSLVEVVS